MFYPIVRSKPLALLLWALLSALPLAAQEWDPASGKSFSRANNLPNDFIYAVYENRQHKLWLPTDHGISCLDKKRKMLKNHLPNF